MSTRTTTRRSALPALRFLAAAAAVGALCACSAGEPSPKAGSEKPAVSSTTTTEAPTKDAPLGAISASADTFDACALLETADLAGVVDAEVELVKLPSSGWMAGQCSVTTTSAGLLASVGVGTHESISASGDPRGTDASTRLETFGSGPDGSTEPKRLEDIGDGAVLGVTGMAAHKDGTYLEVANLGMSDDDLVELVRQVVSGL